jgi:hypothetical protein
MMVPRYEGYSFDSYRLLRYNKIIDVPSNDELRSLVLSEGHRAVYMGHPGVTKMEETLILYYFGKE